MEIFSLLPVTFIYLFNWLPKCADFACLRPPQCLSCFYHLKNYKVISKFFIHMTPPGSISKLLINRLQFNVQKSLSMGMFIVDVATASSPGGTSSGYLLCSSKHLSEWSVLWRKQKISAPCPTPHYLTSQISSEHLKHLILSLSILDLNYYK